MFINVEFDKLPLPKNHETHDIASQSTVHIFLVNFWTAVTKIMNLFGFAIVSELNLCIKFSNFYFILWAKRQRVSDLLSCLFCCFLNTIYSSQPHVLVLSSHIRSNIHYGLLYNLCMYGFTEWSETRLLPLGLETSRQTWIQDFNKISTSDSLITTTNEIVAVKKWQSFIYKLINSWIYYKNYKNYSFWRRIFNWPSSVDWVGVWLSPQ